MAEAGVMVCEQCRHHGPELLSGSGMHFVRELRRCKRCAGLVSVLTATSDWATIRQASYEFRARHSLPVPVSLPDGPTVAAVLNSS